MSSQTLEVDTVERKRFNEIQKNTGLNPNSLKGQLITELDKLDTDSDALVLTYKKDSRRSYFKGIIYAQNKENKDTDYRYSIANDKDNNKLYVLCKEDK